LKLVRNAKLCLDTLNIDDLIYSTIISYLF